MTAPYFVHGVELVNCGGETCCACDRPAVGYTNAHPICATHAGMAAVMADEYAREREDGEKRRAAMEADRIARVGQRFPEIAARLTLVADDMRERAVAVKLAATRFACGHDRTPENTYQNQRGRVACRECRRVQNIKNKRQARRREQLRLRKRTEHDGANPYFEAP